MDFSFKKFLSILYLLCGSSNLFAAPWFTGPILAPAGETVPKGHTNFEIYSFNTIIQGVYDNHGRVTHTPDNKSHSLVPIYTYGLTKKIDVQAIATYFFNHNMGANSNEFGDTTVGLGYQLLKQETSKWRPDIRVTVQEVLPTGRFDHLNPLKNDTDASGLGSFQTAFSLNIQHLQPLTGVHYLRNRLSLFYVEAGNVHIDGFSAYGGTATTHGTVNPGNLRGFDWAAELTLTQNWVAVMEVNGTSRSATAFSGQISFEEESDIDTIGHEAGKQLSLAPAIEFNFSPTIGLIGGFWFPVYGRNTAKFLSYVIALNAYW